MDNKDIKPAEDENYIFVWSDPHAMRKGEDEIINITLGIIIVIIIMAIFFLLDLPLTRCY